MSEGKGRLRAQTLPVNQSSFTFLGYVPTSARLNTTEVSTSFPDATMLALSVARCSSLLSLQPKSRFTATNNICTAPIQTPALAAEW